MTRDARLSALHRGDGRGPRFHPRHCLRIRTAMLLAARSSCLAGGVPDLPSPRLRAAAAGRHSPLRLQDRLRKTPPMSEDGIFVLYIRYVVNNYLRIVGNILVQGPAYELRPRAQNNSYRSRK